MMRNLPFISYIFTWRILYTYATAYHTLSLMKCILDIVDMIYIYIYIYIYSIYTYYIVLTYIIYTIVKFMKSIY